MGAAWQELVDSSSQGSNMAAGAWWQNVLSGWESVEEGGKCTDWKKGSVEQFGECGGRHYDDVLEW